VKSTARRLAAAIIFLAGAARAPAQEPLKLPPPQKQHQWLQQFAGEWEAESTALTPAGEPAMVCKGTLTSRMLGPYWAVSEWKTELAETQIQAIQTLGYDPAKKKYVGTWVDSMHNHLWKYEGEVDSTGKVLTLEAEGPKFFADGKTARFRDAYEFKTADHIVATSSLLGEDGKWVTFMTGHVRRKQ
jgi:hypothetical protein